jgi:23S rRNA (cytidine1920-2'-O)/16S rRNA (cytidine1409-2'-O)-methyltransferase
MSFSRSETEVKRDRLDKILVDRGLAETTRKAQAMIMAGLVFHGQERLDKPGRMIPADLPLTVEKTLPFVSRGGLKLDEALDIFKIDVDGRICADVGSSTGGFTDCLLKRGAARVYAADVDIRQLDSGVRADARVVTIEKNARNLEPSDFSEAPSLIVMDVSFISVLKVLPALKRVMEEGPHAIASPPKGARNDTLEKGTQSPDFPKKGTQNPDFSSLKGSECSVSPFSASLLSLIKPQFEAERGQVGQKGLIRDPEVHRAVLTGVIAGAANLGFLLRGAIACSTRGQKGNREFFALWSLTGEPPADAAVEAWIAAAVADAPPGS